MLRSLPPRGRNALWWGLFVALAAALYGRNLWTHVLAGMDPFIFADDARNQVMPYLRWVEAEAFQDDFIGDYGLATIPPGVRWLFYLGTFLIDPVQLSERLPYPLLALTAYGVGRTAHRLAPTDLRAPVVFASVGFVLAADIYLQRMAGTLPRAFCFPCVALGMWALVEGRVRRAAAVAALSVLFYPTAAVIVAGGVFSVLFVVGGPNRGEARRWSLRRRTGLVGALALAAVLFALPTLIATGRYGPRVTPANLAQYPEGGPAGTHGADDRPPYDGFVGAVSDYLERSAFGTGRPFARGLTDGLDRKLILDVVLILVLLGLAGAGRRHRQRRFLAVILGAALAHIGARILAPYLYAPSRFAMYSIPLFVAVGLPNGIAWLIAAKARGRLGRATVPVGWAGVAGLVFLLGADGPKRDGLTVRIDDEQRRLYGFIESLPKSAFIAGWPDEAMSNLPYLGRRKAYMTGEMHMGYHVGFLESLRDRLHPFFEAYLSPDPAALRRFREERGVTHILVERRDFQRRNRGYMPPYRNRIREHWRRLGSGKPALLNAPEAVVFESPRYLVVDLTKL